MIKNPNANQKPEQIARDQIDQMLIECGWVVQQKTKINLSVGLGVAVTEYQTETGPVDYLLLKKDIGSFKTIVAALNSTKR